MDSDKRTLFGTDGIRGVANSWPMDSVAALRAGQAIAAWFRNGNRKHKIVIGKDTRLSGYMIETALSSGIVSAGLDVYLVGPLPTPGIAFITAGMRADAGVVISASHNPYTDNGIKVFDQSGYKLCDEAEAEIESLMLAPERIESHLARPDAIGKAYRIDDAVGRYIVFLKGTLPRHLSLDGLKIVVDCANGATYKVAPEVFQELGAEVFPVGVAPNGMNINLGVGSTAPEQVQARVRETGADLGIALDGDGDRVILIDEYGEVIDGDAVMAFIGRHLIEQGQLPNNTLVATVASNLGLERALQAVGGRVERTAVGDRYVAQRMREIGANFGGESSGHLIFLEASTTGDGTLAALQSLRVMLETGEPLSELAAQMEPVPKISLSVPVRERRPLEAMPNFARALGKVRKSLNGDGRVLFRYSGTESVARILVEGDDESAIGQYGADLREALLQEQSA